ncbi:MAG: penicillin-binding protein 1A [Alphaproteobacteria bacterium]
MPQFVKYLLGSFAALVCTAFAAVSIYVFVITQDLPGYDALRHYEPPITTRVYAGDGTLIGEWARERRLFVPIQSFPNRVIGAFLSAEDRNFYQHAGIDVFGIVRAMLKNIGHWVEDRRLEGASTITQQVARNFLLSSEYKFSRKVREAVLAMRIDEAFTKDEILELYLNQIYLGQNSYGVAAAAMNYYEKSLDELEVAEAAFLAALPKAPQNYHPIYRKEAAIARRNWVIQQMANNGYITGQEAEDAMRQPLVTRRRAQGAVVEDVDYFVEEVRRQLYEQYGERALYDGGLQVRSTLDTRLQDIGVRALRAGLIKYDRRHGWRGAKAQVDLASNWQATLDNFRNQSGLATWQLAAVTAVTSENDVEIGLQNGATGVIPFSELAWARRQLRNGHVGAPVSRASDVVKPGEVIYVEALKEKGQGVYGLRQVPEVNGGLVALNPHTGQVLALAGGFSFGSSQFDRAMQALRQPGSAFKPFVYAAALDSGYTPATRVLDAPFVMEQGPGLPLWSPQNFTKKYYGLVTLRRAIEQSYDAVTVRMAADVGMRKIARYAERMGVYDKLSLFLANALGAGDTTVLRMASGYASFVNGGRKVTPTLIDRIQDRHGKTVYRHDTRKCDTCDAPEWRHQEEPLLPDDRPAVLSPQTAYQVVSLLEGAVLRGTGAVVSEIGKPLAGKTGTTNEAKDLWFVGFSPDLVCGVYVGFDNPHTLGEFEQAAHTAAPIFKDFMKEALQDTPAIPFRVPPGIVLVSVDKFTGGLASPGAPGTILEAFRPGSEPSTAIYDEATDAIAGASTETEISRGTGGLY